MSRRASHRNIISLPLVCRPEARRANSAEAGSRSGRGHRTMDGYDYGRADARDREGAEQGGRMALTPWADW
jgi:hypothetical protein